MHLPQGSAIAILAGIGFIAGLLFDEIAWGLIAGAAAGALVDAWRLSRRDTP